mgnify:CR=1 FL=1
MAGIDLATAYVNLTVSARGMREAIRAELRQSEADIRRLGQQVGNEIGSGVNDGARDGERAMQRLKKAIEDATGDVKVNADTAEAQAAVSRIREQISSLPDGRASVDVNTAAAKSAMDAINAEMSRLNGQQIDIAADADVAAALAGLSSVNAEASRLDGRRVNMNVDADTGAAMGNLAALNMAANNSSGGMSALKLAAAAVAPALIPIGAVGVPALASLGGMAVGAAAGMGTLLMAIKPVTEAMKALDAVDEQAGAAAQQHAQQEQARAKAITSATEQVSSAQRSLANTRASVADAAQSAAERVSQAEAGVAKARETASHAATAAAERVMKAQQSVRDAEEQGARQIAAAQRAITDAREQGARRVADALAQVDTAERTLASAQRTALSAQQALNDARDQARRTLQDMNMQTRGAALAERAGVLQVQEARERLAKTMSDPKASQLDREQAKLAVDQALQGLDETRLRRQRLTADTAQANKAGINGSKQVRAAQQQVVDSTQRSADAARALQKARADVGVAQSQAARAVADAEAKAGQTRTDVARRVQAAQQGVSAAVREQAYAARQSAQQIQAAQASVASALRAQQTQQRQGAQQIASAQASVASAQRALQDAYATTGAKASSAMTKAQQAMAKLSPAGRSFVKFMRSSVMPAFEDLGRTAQTGMLPGVQQAMRNLMPAMAPLKALTEDISRRLGGMAVAASKALTGPFWTKFFTFIGTQAGPWMERFGRIVGNVMTGLAGLFMKAAPAGNQFGSVIERLTQQFSAWGQNGGGKGFENFLKYAQTALPKVIAFVGAFAGAFSQVTVALAPLGPAMLGILTQLAQFIARQNPTTIRNVALALGAVVGAYKLMTTAVRVATAVQAAHALITRSSTAAKRAETAAENAGMLTRARATASMVAQRVASVAMTAATKTMAVAQRALNLVMRMNPIGIVITALIALGAGLVLAYKKSETFRNIVNAVWRVVKSAIKGTVDWFLNTAWPTMRNVLTWIGDKMNAAKGVIQRAWSAIKAAFKAVVDWVKGAFKRSWDGIKTVLSKPVELGKQLIDRQITGMRRIFTAIRDFMKGAFKRSWDGLKKIFTAPIELAKSSISGILGKDDKSGLRGVFSNALEAIKKIWEKLKDIVAKPINGVIGIINNPFISGFNKLGKPFGLTLPTIPKIKGYASGGTIPGPWKGPRADNVLGVSSSGMPVARVNPGEFITQVSSTRSMEKKHPGALNYINKFGTLPGHASGGFAGMPHANTGAPHTARGRYESYRPSVSIVALGNFLRSKGFAVGEHPRFGGVAPVHMGTSLHYAGQALDINADGMAGGEDRNLSALARALVREGWGTIWHSAGHFDHLHVDTGIYSKIGGKLSRISKTNALTDAIGGFASAIFSPLKNGAFKLIDGAVGKFGGGDFTKKLLGGAAKKVIEGAIGWGNGKTDVVDTSYTEGNVSSSKAASAWIPQIKQALALNGLPASDANVQKWVRQIQSESGGNPNAIQQVRDINWPHNRARGLVQVIPPTFRAYHVPGTSNNIFDPIANLAAGINYAKKTYGVGMGAIGRGHGYAGGGLVERQIPVFDNGGTLAPGINVVNNKLGKPEPLVRPEQYGRGAPIFNIHGAPNDTAVDLAREVTWEMRRLETAGKYRGA